MVEPTKVIAHKKPTKKEVEDSLSQRSLALHLKRSHQKPSLIQKVKPKSLTKDFQKAATKKGPAPKPFWTADTG